MAAVDYERLELLVLDVDGVLTDGRIILDPDGRETKMFNVRDGSGLRHWKRSGRKLAIISGRGSPAIEHRARELDVDAVRLNAKTKLPVYRQVLAELGVSPEQTAVMGDDLTDLPMMRHCGLAIAPAGAAEEVVEAADLVTDLPGGAGCVREVTNLILRKAGDWSAIMARYLDDETIL
ncbi:MAG: KdsC family phosphatase [Planctomycetota bacterium]|jgi:3-deoxy-D-manno-octulosonate 8-phosphate phosphatase (KDO 8-P phosphatase)